MTDFSLSKVEASRKINEPFKVDFFAFKIVKNPDFKDVFDINRTYSFVISNPLKTGEAYSKSIEIKKIDKDDKTRMLEDGMYVIDLGYRNKQPVALIEKTMQDNSKEYIIAFNYKITDKKIDWAYGYYYNENISKAKQDFNKVLSGGNLANTFDKNKKDKER